MAGEPSLDDLKRRLAALRGETAHSAKPAPSVGELQRRVDSLRGEAAGSTASVDSLTKRLAELRGSPAAPQSAPSLGAKRPGARGDVSAAVEAARRALPEDADDDVDALLVRMAAMMAADGDSAGARNALAAAAGKTGADTATAVGYGPPSDAAVFAISAAAQAATERGGDGFARSDSDSGSDSDSESDGSSAKDEEEDKDEEEEEDDDLRRLQASISGTTHRAKSFLQAMGGGRRGPRRPGV